MSKPLRVQGAFVSDGEIEALVENIKSTCGNVEYSQEIAASIEIEAAGKKGNGVGASSGGTDGGIEDEDSFLNCRDVPCRNKSCIASPSLSVTVHG